MSGAAREMALKAARKGDTDTLRAALDISSEARGAGQMRSELTGRDSAAERIRKRARAHVTTTGLCGRRRPGSWGCGTVWRRVVPATPPPP
jgi:hypothetical protein